MMEVAILKPWSFVLDPVVQINIHYQNQEIVREKLCIKGLHQIVREYDKGAYTGFLVGNGVKHFPRIES